MNTTTMPAALTTGFGFSPRFGRLVMAARRLALREPSLDQDGVHEAAIEAAGDLGFDPAVDEAEADEAVVTFVDAYVAELTR